jgi:hypothetical protein
MGMATRYRDIVDTIEIEADPAFVLAALREQPAPGFAIEKESLGGIELRGTTDGTRLHFAFARMSTGTRVAVLHLGLPIEHYEQSLEAWRCYLADLKSVVETGEAA